VSIDRPTRLDLLDKLGREFAEILDDLGYFRTCANCDNWKHGDEICGVFNLRPPVAFIVNPKNCQHHSDLIPF